VQKSEYVHKWIYTVFRFHSSGRADIPMNPKTLFALAAPLLGGLFCCVSTLAGQPDPFAGNNTLYPTNWTKAFRTSNYEYPAKAVRSRWVAGGPEGVAAAGLTPKTAPTYVAAVKKFIQKDIEGVITDPLHWTPQLVGWYDMPWGGQGTPTSIGTIDPESGRESLLGSYTGQILQPYSYPSAPPAKAFQNHAVVYYNDVAAGALGRIWKNPFKPDVYSTQFPEGSIVVKIEGVTLKEKDWSVLKGSPVSHIYRPSTESLLNNTPPEKRVAEITEMHFLQMAVRIKDSVASPDTGWVFIAFYYDCNVSSPSAWERTVPAGAMWGNDPKLDAFPDGLGPKGVLQETWVNPAAAPFVKDGLGWGGRLAGPLDVGIRHNVVTVSGKRYGDVPAPANQTFRATSCISCHSAAQYPFVANLYPSPNMVFPEEGGQFLFFDPGTPLWGAWFQNRPGTVAMSGKGRDGILAVDYDMMLTFALMQANGDASAAAFIRHGLAGH
jgi:hypothetical protein